MRVDIWGEFVCPWCYIGERRFGRGLAARAEAGQALGITGVPFYVIDGKYGVSGAQPAEALTQALRQAWAR